MRTWLTAVMVGLTAGLVVAPVPAQAVSRWGAVTCGSVLTRDSYLRADLTCSGPGLAVSFSRSARSRPHSVVLDLRGHQLRGSAGPAISVTGPGVVSVLNGTIEGWESGVLTVPGDPGEGLDVAGVSVERVTFRGNGTALESSAFPNSSSATPVVVDRSLFLGNTSAVTSRDGGPVSVDRSVLRENGEAFRIHSGSLSVARSTLDDNQTGAVCTESSCALTDSSIAHNGLAVSLGEFTEATVTGNVFTNNRTGYEQTTFATGRVSGNQFTGNLTAVTMTDSTAAVEDNTFVRNGAAFILEDVGSVDEDTSLSHNMFNHNRDGVSAPDGGALLTSNTAIGNIGRGIFAPGSTDGGGNVAYGNGTSPQCVGVVC